MMVDERKTGDSLRKRFVAREIKDLKSLDLWRAALAEFIGTGLLVWCGIGAGLYAEGSTPVSSTHIALEGGLFLAVIITTLSTVSGGHVNPAISLGFFIIGDIGVVRLLLYIIAQTVGGIAGSGLLKAMTPPELQNGTFGLIEPGANVTTSQALAAEIIITFFLDFGTFSFLDKGRTDVTGSVPIVVGFLVSVNIFATWNISGGCMNPARSFGPVVVTGNYKYAWVYWVGPMVGGGLGALIYDRVFSTNVCKQRLWNCIKCENEIDSERAINFNSEKDSPVTMNLIENEPIKEH